MFVCSCLLFFFFNQKTAYEMRISDWSSDVCSSDLYRLPHLDGLIALFGQQRVCSLECAVRFAILVIFEQRAREFELTGKKIGLELQQRAILGFRSEQITAFARDRKSVV